MDSIPVTLVRGRTPREALSRERKPSWLRVRPPGSSEYRRLKQLMQQLRLNTVCEEANCPNIGDCWDRGTATFMILGDVCTRACAYCNVVHGRPAPVDQSEPERLAEAVSRLGLRYIVVTSVDRDDLEDGGASIFARTITSIRTRVPRCRVEVLIPDFSGRLGDLQTVLAARPSVLNHNIETVERLYRTVRPAGRYGRALELLARAGRLAPTIPTKSGVMVGLGERPDEIVTTLRDLRGAGCDLLTIGQYLRPSVAHIPVARFYTPDEFADLKHTALELGFGHVESGPLVRSSFHAREQTGAYDARDVNSER